MMLSVEMLLKARKFTQVCGHQVRGMATLKTIQLRLKSVSNIQKITRSMKMVSAAKYSRAERVLADVRPYGEGAQAFYDKAEIEDADDVPKKLLIAMTSDRGLCGGAHSSVAKKIKSSIESHENITTKFICVGEKARSILEMLYGDYFVLVCSDVGRKPPIFKDASKLAEQILDSGYEYSSGKIVYNKFKSMASFVTSEISIYSLSSVVTAPKILLYDSIDSELIQCYLEYSLASLLYYCMIEAACSEQSARMAAMDNATKNAGEMITKLQQEFNRSRQSQITNELIEIISGASALK